VLRPIWIRGSPLKQFQNLRTESRTNVTVLLDDVRTSWLTTTSHIKNDHFETFSSRWSAPRLVHSVPRSVFVLSHQAHVHNGQLAAGSVHFAFQRCCRPAVLQRGWTSQEGPGTLRSAAAELTARGQLPAVPNGIGSQPAATLHSASPRQEVRRRCCSSCGRRSSYVPRARSRLALEGRTADVETVVQYPTVSLSFNVAPCLYVRASTSVCWRLVACVFSVRRPACHQLL
jgi:hypothetical protein